MTYDNTNRGTLGKNKRREKDSHPEYQGQINIDGKDYWLSAWIKEGRDNEKFFSLSVRPKEEKARNSQESKNTPNKSSQGGTRPVADFEVDIPFSSINSKVY